DTKAMAKAFATTNSTIPVTISRGRGLERQIGNAATRPSIITTTASVCRWLPSDPSKKRRTEVGTPPNPALQPTGPAAGASVGAGPLAGPAAELSVRRLSFSEENIAFESSPPNVSTTILGLR